MGADLRFMPAKPEHVELLAPMLRPEDLAEVQALGYVDGRAALTASLDASVEAFAVVVGGEVIAMVGVCTVVDQRLGQIWFLTGIGFPRWAKSFTRCMRIVLRVWLRAYERIGNLIDSRYEAAVRFARWFGFEVFPAVSVPSSDVLFHPAFLGRS